MHCKHVGNVSMTALPEFLVLWIIDNESSSKNTPENVAKYNIWIWVHTAHVFLSLEVYKRINSARKDKIKFYATL